jgi:hypothetical protein
VDPRTPPDQHDTVVLATQPVPAAPPYPPARAYPPAGPGWQDVGDWRGAVAHQAPTAWSRVPPFLPPTAPPVLVMRNNAAVVGATLGSVSLFLSLIPLIGVVTLLLAPIGLMSSGVGLVVGMSRRVGRAGAVWGLLTSGLALLVCMAWTALLLTL